MISLPNPSKMTYSEEVQTKIDELKAENYYDEDMFDFINQYGNDSFLKFYEQYVQNGEDYCYEAVDAFIDEFGIECIEHFSDAYHGSYDSEKEFAEEFVNDCWDFKLNDTPIVVDWQKTWDCNLQYDFAINDGYVFNKNF